MVAENTDSSKEKRTWRIVQNDETRGHTLEIIFSLVLSSFFFSFQLKKLFLAMFQRRSNHQTLDFCGPFTNFAKYFSSTRRLYNQQFSFILDPMKFGKNGHFVHIGGFK